MELAKRSSRLKCPVIDIETIDRMRKYQHALVDEMLLNTRKKGAMAIYFDEIKAVECWLKDNTKEVVHNNLRKLKL